MHIKSLVRSRLTKYFQSDLYMKNRSSRADAILVDMETITSDDKYKLKSFENLLKSNLSLPSLYIDPVNSNMPNLDYFRNNLHLIRGMAIRSKDETLNESFDDIDVFNSETNNIYTMIWDLKSKRITHAIIVYNRIGVSDVNWHSSLRRAVSSCVSIGIQPLACRSTCFMDSKTAIHEFEELKELGFRGAVLRNPNLIEPCNNIFENK